MGEFKTYLIHNWKKLSESELEQQYDNLDMIIGYTFKRLFEYIDDNFEWNWAYYTIIVCSLDWIHHELRDIIRWVNDLTKNYNYYTALTLSRILTERWMNIDLILGQKKDFFEKLYIFCKYTVDFAFPEIFESNTDDIYSDKEKFLEFKSKFKNQRNFNEWYDYFDEYKWKRISKMTEKYLEKTFNGKNDKMIMYKFLSKFVHSTSFYKPFSWITWSDAKYFILNINYTIVKSILNTVNQSYFELIDVNLSDKLKEIENYINKWDLNYLYEQLYEESKYYRYQPK